MFACVRACVCAVSRSVDVFADGCLLVVVCVVDCMCGSIGCLFGLLPVDCACGCVLGCSCAC